MGTQKYIPIIGKQYGQWTVISTEIKRHSEKKITELLILK